VIDLGPLFGGWRNADSDAAPPAIHTVRLSRTDEQLRLHMIGVDGFDWGMASVERVFTAGPAAVLAVGITASYEREGRRARVHGNIKLGVMVLAAFMHVGDQAVFTRDFLFEEGT
jgi:hypothetical protein